MFHCLSLGLIFFVALACGPVDSGSGVLIPLDPLPEVLTECSGMVLIGKDTFIGLNDSGNPAELIIFSLKPGSTPRKVKIKGATNHDWEELTADDQYIYIGDTGNNTGARKDLTIYRVSKMEIHEDAEVIAEPIFFNYPEQENFLPNSNHNFDCEAMVCVGDSLYLFTKNRKNHKTDLYSISKIPGKYHARHLGQFDVQGLVTGAAFRSSVSGNELALVGYTDKKEGFHPFVVYFEHVEGTHFFNAPSKRLSFKGKEQTETILFFDDRHVYVSNESENGEPAFVYQIDVSN